MQSVRDAKPASTSAEFSRSVSSKRGERDWGTRTRVRWFGFRRELTSEETPPRGWRLAWREPRRRSSVYFLAPLHILARAIREIAWRVRLLWTAPGREESEIHDAERLYIERRRLAEEFARGYLVGWRECFEVCEQVFEEELGSEWSN